MIPLQIYSLYPGGRVYAGQLTQAQSEGRVQDQAARWLKYVTVISDALKSYQTAEAIFHSILQTVQFICSNMAFAPWTLGKGKSKSRKQITILLHHLVFSIRTSRSQHDFLHCFCGSTCRTFRQTSKATDIHRCYYSIGHGCSISKQHEHFQLRNAQILAPRGFDSPILSSWSKAPGSDRQPGRCCRAAGFASGADDC